VVIGYYDTGTIEVLWKWIEIGGNEEEGILAKTLIELRNITTAYEMRQSTNYAALQDVKLRIQEGEFIAILGPSGSGKSKLLKMIAGLGHPVEGTSNYSGQKISSMNPNVSMMLPSAPLFPWLTVFENIKVGLLNKKINKQDKIIKTIQVIEMLGVSGIESVYPRDLSAEMRQRVGIGRALISEPDVLLLDEPFSQLDIRAAENLCKDILTLWLGRKMNSKALVITTTNAEEAIYLSDRILIVTSTPGEALAEIKINLPHWRDRKGAAFMSIMNQVDSVLGKTTTLGTMNLMDTMHLTKLPTTSIEMLTDFLAMQEESKGNINIYSLAEGPAVDSRESFPLIDMAVLLGFSQIQDGQISLTQAGRKFIKATAFEGKEVFAEQLLRYIPMINQMLRYLESSSSKKISATVFEEILKGYFTPEQTREQLEILIGWGLHANLFSYDKVNHQLYIE